MRGKLIAVDFDGTVVQHMFPAIGEPLPHAIRVLTRIANAGNHIILYTCREDDQDIRHHYLTDAVKFLEDKGVRLRSVNENLMEDEFRPEGSRRRKPYAELYIDDKGFGMYEDVNWLVIEAFLEGRKWI